MNAKELIALRLANQGLTSAEFNTCADVVSHFGAMQSQDYSMAKWAVGMRMQNASDAAIEMSIQAGEIIRTHILRPTWHFVHVNDVRWMMELSAPNVKKATQYVDKQVGLTDDIFKKAWKVIETAMNRDNNLTKEDLTDRLAKKKINAEGLLATQILIRAELEMRICNGERKDNKVTYTLFDKKVPPSENISRKDALVNLASVYFKSRGPATAKDFAWWSGMSMSDATFGISGLGSDLKSTSVNGLNYLYFENAQPPKKKVTALLPSYDEYMVGYTEGRDVAFPANIDKSFIGNGIFKPLVLFNNTIAGTWKKVKKEPFVEIEFIDGHKKYNGLSAKVESLKSFLYNSSEILLKR
ncbi:MAG TPA: winged helix DNA-binding domain-containing protein [Ohtaekwangia sp.]|uniref:winged helix DNA-binding domain-containing protein n=1 Tax=Ohtaekwangia sp. TaxID=2066019 RepID=UPI002F936256